MKNFERIIEGEDVRKVLSSRGGRKREMSMREATSIPDKYLRMDIPVEIVDSDVDDVRYGKSILVTFRVAGFMGCAVVIDYDEDEKLEVSDHEISNEMEKFLDSLTNSSAVALFWSSVEDLAKERAAWELEG